MATQQSFVRFPKVLFCVLCVMVVAVLIWYRSDRILSYSVGNAQIAAVRVQHTKAGVPVHCHHFPLTVPRKSSLLPCHFRDKPPSNCTHRLRAELACNESSADIIYKWVEVDSPPTRYDYNDACVARVVAEKCTKGGLTPRVVHYVNFGRQEFPFHSFLGIVSAVRHIQPCLILFLADELPYGEHWDRIIQLVPQIVYVSRTAPTAIFGHVINVVHHKSDVARLEMMRKFGGIYSDLDHILLNPIDVLLNYTVVMGTEDPFPNFGNGFFLGRPGAKFFEIWYDSYRTFDDNQWAEHSCVMPYKIQQTNSGLGVHVVHSFFRPNWNDMTSLFYEKPYKWEKQYGIHLYHNKNRKFFEGRIETVEGSLGDVTRYTLFGNKRACMRNVSERPMWL